MRVVIVDDSAAVRGLLSRWISAAPGYEVVGAAENGRAALAIARSSRPQIVLLDLEMPEMDGLEALPLLLAEHPGLSVIVVSTLTRRNADISLRCLQMGAVDYLPKPSAARELTTGMDFRAELLAKLDGLKSRHGPIAPAPARPGAPALAPAGRSRPRVLAIGASTGGPRAVIEVVRGLASTVGRLPVLVVQHMPAVFTTVFARQIESDTGVPCREAQHGEPIAPGIVLVAPGGRHFGLAGTAAAASVRIDDGPPIRHCRPAFDLMLRDCAAVYGGGTLAAILTGMGSDGLDGARAVVETGGAVLAQDEASSVVWGMPGSVVRAGLAQAVLPVARIAAEIEAIALRDGPTARSGS